MTGVQTAGALEWQVPGPGTWTIDAVHHPRPVTRYFAEMHPEPFRPRIERARQPLTDRAKADEPDPDGLRGASEHGRHDPETDG